MIKNPFIIKVYLYETKEKARKLMKKMNFFKGKAKIIFAGTFLAGIIFTSNVFATTSELQLDTSKAYDEWNCLSDEQKEQIVMPRTYDVEIPDSILSEYEIDTMPRVLNQLLGNCVNPFDEVGSVNDSRFNLAENLNLRVEHQRNTTECWAFSLIKALETNKALKNKLYDIEDFSERHMDYATSRTFTDGVNEAGFNREVGTGGLIPVGLAYLTNGQGAVLESDMPFKNEEKKISLAEIDKNVNTIVNDYYNLPTIHKEYEKDSNGNTISVKYKKANGTEYTESELNAVRNIIKEHLVENGAIATMTAGSLSNYYNNSSAFQATAYNCNDTDKTRDHAITIVGWDDNYPRENFGDGRMPSTNGAYIVLNSYGDTSFDNGYLYISYEDYFIEEELYGISSTGSVDYDYIYQNDYYGGVFKIGSATQTKGSIGTVYNRDKNKNEILDSVGVTLSNYSKIEIYVNPENDSFATSKLIKVAEPSEVLTPGFHRIDITPTQLTGDNFTIVVKITPESGGFYFQIEANVEKTAYAFVESENRSYVSLSSNTWTNISNLTVSGLDMKTADVCIKAYTIEGEKIEEPEENTNNPEDNNNSENNNPEDVPSTNPDTDDSNNNSTDNDNTTNENPDINQDDNNTNDDNTNDDNTNNDNQNEESNTPEQDKTEEKVEVSSTKYTITEDGYIMNIEFNTTKEKLLNNIQVKSGKNVINSDGSSVKDDEVIKTGMKLRLSDGSLYTLIVRGDINMDGRVSLTDLSKLILHYNGVKGFELAGDALKGADMNIDGKVSLVDVSQLVVLYNSI